MHTTHTSHAQLFVEQLDKLSKFRYAKRRNPAEAKAYYLSDACSMLRQADDWADSYSESTSAAGRLNALAIFTYKRINELTTSKKEEDREIGAGILEMFMLNIVTLRLVNTMIDTSTDRAIVITDNAKQMLEHVILAMSDTSAKTLIPQLMQTFALIPKSPTERIFRRKWQWVVSQVVLEQGWHRTGPCPTEVSHLLHFVKHDIDLTYRVSATHPPAGSNDYKELQYVEQQLHALIPDSLSTPAPDDSPVSAFKKILAKTRPASTEVSGGTPASAPTHASAPPPSAPPYKPGPGEPIVGYELPPPPGSRAANIPPPTDGAPVHMYPMPTAASTPQPPKPPTISTPPSIAIGTGDSLPSGADADHTSNVEEDDAAARAKQDLMARLHEDTDGTPEAMPAPSAPPAAGAGVAVPAPAQSTVAVTPITDNARREMPPVDGAAKTGKAYLNWLILSLEAILGDPATSSASLWKSRYSDNTKKTLQCALQTICQNTGFPPVEYNDVEITGGTTNTAEARFKLKFPHAKHMRSDDIDINAPLGRLLPGCILFRHLTDNKFEIVVRFGENSLALLSKLETCLRRATGLQTTQVILAGAGDAATSAEFAPRGGARPPAPTVPVGTPVVDGLPKLGPYPTGPERFNWLRSAIQGLLTHYNAPEWAGPTRFKQNTHTMHAWTQALLRCAGISEADRKSFFVVSQKGMDYGLAQFNVKCPSTLYDALTTTPNLQFLFNRRKFICTSMAKGKAVIEFRTAEIDAYFNNMLRETENLLRDYQPETHTATTMA